MQTRRLQLQPAMDPAEHDSGASPNHNDGASPAPAPPPPPPCWAKDVEKLESDYTCQETLQMMCRRYDIREEDYTPLCAQQASGPCIKPLGASNALCVFESMLEAGVRFPLHTFYDKALTHFGLAPSQLTPNSWRCLSGFVLLCDRVGVRPTVAVFRHYFELCSNRGSDRGFYYLQPANNNNNNNNHAPDRLFKKENLPDNTGWKNKFFFLDSNNNKSWGCPKEWGTTKTGSCREIELTEAARTAIGKLEPEKGIKLMGLLKISEYNNTFPIRPPLPTLAQLKVKEEEVVGQHDEAHATETATVTPSAITPPPPPKKMKMMCESYPSPSPSPAVTGTGLGPRQLGGVAMDDMEAPLPGFSIVPVGSSSRAAAIVDDQDDNQPSMSHIVFNFMQKTEGELNRSRQQLRVERAEHADQVSRLKNDVIQLTEKLEAERHKSMTEARRLTEDLETVKAEHSKTLAAVAERAEELKLAQASQAQLMSKIELLSKEREEAQSENTLKVSSLMKDLQAEKDKQMTMDRQFREELQATRAEHTAQVRQLEEAHAAEMNTSNQQYQLKVINAEHMSTTMIGGLLSERYAKGLRDMRDLALMVCPDADPAKLTPEALTVQAAATPQVEAPMDLEEEAHEEAEQLNKWWW